MFRYLTFFIFCQMNPKILDMSSVSSCSAAVAKIYW